MSKKKRNKELLVPQIIFSLIMGNRKIITVNVTRETDENLVVWEPLNIFQCKNLPRIIYHFCKSMKKGQKMSQQLKLSEIMSDFKLLMKMSKLHFQKFTPVFQVIGPAKMSCYKNNTKTVKGLRHVAFH